MRELRTWAKATRGGVKGWVSVQMLSELFLTALTKS